tara:strand:+ start:289 stop:477 length:189 start_codon:yes stop_codon:yes gene_type:complete
MDSILYYTWEMFTSLETNAWWLMMVVFTFTCITFIVTNVMIRKSIEKIEENIMHIMEEIFEE